MICLTVLAVLLICDLSGMSVASAETHPSSLTGKSFGSGCKWGVSNKVLYIWPTDGVSGTLPSNSNNTSYFWPWNSNDDCRTVRRVVIEPGVHVRSSGSLSYMFYQFASVVSFDFSGLDTTGLANMQYMFAYCGELRSLDVSSFNFSSCVNTSFMFVDCSKLISLNLSGIDTSNVTNMNSMFCNCSSLVNLDLTGWQTSSLSDMGSMFSGCFSIRSLDLSNFDTAFVTDMSSLFASCSNLSSLNISGWDVHNVTNMGSMFANCLLLNSVDLSSWNTFSLRRTGSMFLNCYHLSSVNLGVNLLMSSPDILLPVAGGSGCTGKWIRDDGVYGPYTPSELASNYNSSMAGTWVWERGVRGPCAIIYSNGDFVFQSTNEAYSDRGSVIGAFYDFENQASTGTPDWNGACDYVTHVIFETPVRPLSVSYWFSGMKRVESFVGLDNLDLSACTLMRFTFSQCYYSGTLDLRGFDVSNVVSMEGLFSSSRIHVLNISGWDVRNVKNADRIFSSMGSSDEGSFSIDIYASDLHWDNLTVCNSLFYTSNCNIVNVPNWSFGKITSWSSSFCNYFHFDVLDARNWNLDGITSCYYCCRMWGNTSGSTVDLSGWHSNTLVSATQVFEYGYFGFIDLTGWDMPVLQDIHSMFAYSSHVKRIVGLDTWDATSFTNVNYLFTQCYDLEYVDVSTWNTSSLVSANSVFYQCQSLETIDVSSWDLRNCTANSSMFYVPSSSFVLKSIILGPNFRFVSGSSCYFPYTRVDGVFNGWWEREDGAYGPFAGNTMHENWTPDMAGKWVYGALAVGCVTNDNEFILTRSRESWSSQMYSCRQGTYTDIYGNTFTGMWFGSVEYYDDYPYWYSRKALSGVTSCYVVGDRNIYLHNCAEFFGGAKNLVSCDLSKVDVSACTNMDYMFSYCISLESIDVSGLDTGNVMTMMYMFYNCSSLVDVNVTSFDMSSVTSVCGMFGYCTILPYLDLSNWDTSNINMNYMFQECKNLSRIDLGEHFTFRNSVSSCVLPVPSVYDGSAFTGKWIREDDPSVAYTVYELRDLYNGSTMAGTYVWQSSEFEIMFTGGIGNMENAVMRSTYSHNVLPENELRMTSMVFVGWEDRFGNLYSDKDVVDGRLYPAGSVEIFTAVFVPRDNRVDAINGEFYFNLYGGEVASFDDIPGNTYYQVYEDTPDGWILVLDGNTSGTVLPDSDPNVFFENKYDPEHSQISFVGQKKVVDSRLNVSYPYAGEYLFILSQIVDDEVVDLQSCRNGDHGVIQFNPIELDEIGTFVYQIREVAGSDNLIDYDEHVETLVVSVYDNGSGVLVSSVTTDDDGIVFVNTLNDFGSIVLTKHAVDEDGLDDWQSGAVFIFDIRFYDDYGFAPDEVCSGYLRDIAFENNWDYDVSTGIMRVMLSADNNPVVIDNIPFGVCYDVTEVALHD